MNRLTALAAALPLFSLLAAAPAHAQQPIAVSGPYTLTLPMIQDDLAVTEFAARRPLSAAEKTQVTMIDLAQFRREPAWSYQPLRRAATDLKNLRRMDPVRLAEWRKVNFTNAYFQRDSHVTMAEKQTYLAIIARANPIVSVDTTTKTVICEHDIDAWLTASRLLAKASGVPADPRSSLVSYAHTLKLGELGRVRAANMERNWAAYQLGWKNEPPSFRREVLTRLIGLVHQGVKEGQPGGGCASGSGLVLADDAYGDYPYSLDPKFAVLRPKLMALSMQQALRSQRNSNAILGWTIG